MPGVNLNLLHTLKPVEVSLKPLSLFSWGRGLCCHTHKCWEFVFPALCLEAVPSSAQGTRQKYWGLKARQTP